MQQTKQRAFPRWIFAIIAIGALLASGIFLGIMSVEGVKTGRLIQAIAFALLGLVMFWGAMHAQQ